jgi:hypothetical protein
MYQVDKLITALAEFSEHITGRERERERERERTMETGKER